MTSSVIYEGELRTTCTHLSSGTNFETDAPVDNNGKGERFSPTDLMATSLATCMVTVMGIKARSLGFDLNGVKIEVLKTMNVNPRRIAAIDLVFHFPESLNQIDEKVKLTLKNVGENCPVFLSLHPEIRIKINWAQWN